LFLLGNVVLSKPVMNSPMIAFILSEIFSLLIYWQLSSMGASKMIAGRVDEGGLDLGSPGLHQ
jgi:hypothetical protein